MVAVVMAAVIAAVGGCGSGARHPKSNAAVQEIQVGVGSPPLKGTLTLPPGRGPFPAVVLVSGSGPNDQNLTLGPNHPFLDIARGLAVRGIATVRYDKRTLDYARSIDRQTFTVTQEYVPDALAAIQLLEHESAVDRHRIFVLGYSQGGTYAPLIAKRAPQVAGVILLAAGAEPNIASMVRQLRYQATLPGDIGAQSRAQLPQLERIAPVLSSATALEKKNPRTILWVFGPRYYLSELRYDEVTTARTIPQPLLLLQADRDYQTTVHDSLNVWLKGLHSRKGVTVVRFPNANHLFIDGTGPPTPLEYFKPGQVEPKVITAITSWISEFRATSS
jgi:pimeloyl-ACP methyl ester carboxylesterase